MRERSRITDLINKAWPLTRPGFFVDRKGRWIIFACAIHQGPTRVSVLIELWLPRHRSDQHRTRCPIDRSPGIASDGIRYRCADRQPDHRPGKPWPEVHFRHPPHSFLYATQFSFDLRP